MSILRSIRQKIRHGLVFQVIADQLSRVGIEVKPYYWVCESPFAVSPSFGDEFREYSCDLFGPEEIRIIARERPWRSERKMLRAIERGNLCVGLKRGNEIAAFNWFEFETCGLGTLESNQVYAFDMYTMKEFRGRGLAPYLRYKSYEVLQEMGRDTVFSQVDCFNRSSIQYKRKINARFISLVLYINLLGKFKRHWLLRKYPQ